MSEIRRFSNSERIENDDRPSLSNASEGTFPSKGSERTVLERAMTAEVLARKNLDRSRLSIQMVYLEHLDFGDTKAVVNWLDHVAPVAQNKDVIDEGISLRILDIFAANGYFPNINTEEAYEASDRNNSGRYLIGQALDGLKHFGAIDFRIYNAMSRDWHRGQSSSD